MGLKELMKLHKKLNARLILDVQGDEPLINPKSIDKVINFHLKNKKFDIILQVFNLLTLRMIIKI